MLDKGLRLIQQATDLQHVPGLVLKRNAQFPLDVHEGARRGCHISSPLGGLEQLDRHGAVGVHCDRGQNGPLAAPFVTSA
jgi:hypothetical protein